MSRIIRRGKRRRRSRREQENEKDHQNIKNLNEKSMHVHGFLTNHLDHFGVTIATDIKKTVI